MKKIKNPELFRKIKLFLTEYLPSIRKRSPNTIISYKTTLNMFLTYLAEHERIQLHELSLNDFSENNIRGFMEWLKKERNNAAPTVNLRYSHIRQFCKYLMKNGMLDYTEYIAIQEIVNEPDTRREKFVFLSIEEMKIILEQPNTKKKNGIRDKFFISLLYDSGCRNQEILDLRLKDFVITKSGDAEMHIIGKGRKFRITPISKEVVDLFTKYCKFYHPQMNPNDLMFYTVRHNITMPMSADNVARFMNTYEAMVKKSLPELPHLHPHLFRHTRAMHLYSAGVPLPLISEWLGHSRMETTQIYAKATIDMKRNAVQKATSNGVIVFKGEPFRYANDDEMIKKLYGLS